MSVAARLEEIEETLKGGVLGVAATFLPTGRSVFHNADTEFPLASVIKAAIVAEVYTQAAEGKLALDAPVTVEKDNFVSGSGVLAHLSPGLTLPLRDLAMLAICVSDNTASNLCLRAAGGPGAVNERMHEAWGLQNTTIHRPIRFQLGPDDPPHTATGTPRDMHRLMTLLAEGKIHSPDVSASVLRLLETTQADDILPRYLDVNPFAADLQADAPPFVVRHKTGSITGVRHDAGVIERGDKKLALCVYTKNVPDGRWTPANIGSEAGAQVSKLLCDHFFAD